MKAPKGAEYGDRAGEVPGAELIRAYMNLHPEWTCRSMVGNGDGLGAAWIESWEDTAVAAAAYQREQSQTIGAVWIETWEGTVVASASYTREQSRALGLRGLMYARTFVAVSVAEGFAMLAGTA